MVNQIILVGRLTGDIVGVKGRVAKLNNDDSMVIICEKLTFLYSEKKKENE